jgi:hypothetical protein
MNSEADETLMSESLSSTLGRIDALTAAVFGILELSKNIPELSMAIKENMAEQSANRSPDSEDPQYIQAFQDTRDQILKVLR